MTTTFTNVHQGRYYGYSYSGPKWRCAVCGRTGYGDPATAGRHHWSEACKRGHSPCEWCGRLLTLRLDGTPRVHARCPERPEDVELLRLLAAEVRTDTRAAVRGPTTDTAAALLERLTTDLPGGDT
ncbi:hypothetical protein [Nocardioides panaciterrulae]|uniref:Uncharacterized protein n=1 Tax=Nocardioides panaciterrulae TaxID=661492 RepID=A0A7Y9EA71_9ACTN|nr:hypothetical protein [Nocardioides panaciterrulae]NYD43949.1 hypothetical protein [Nocardioides panaciterrulae]